MSLSGAEFNIDAVTGPVLGSHPVLGMGGAYTALAAGTDSVALNPAAFASRHLWGLEWFEWDWSFDFIPGTLHNTDFDNNGQPGFTYSDFVFLTFGLGLYFGDLGLGGLFRQQTYRIGADTDLNLVLGNFGIGHGFLDGDLVLGLGIRSAQLFVSRASMRQSLVDFIGVAPEAGVVYRPAWAPFRIGVAARAPVISEPLDRAAAERTSITTGLTLPAEVRLPWEVQAGFAWQFGSRPLNRKWVNPHDVEAELKREMHARWKARQRDAWREEQGVANEPTTDSQTHRPTNPAFWKAERMRRKREERDVEVEEIRLAGERLRAYERLSRSYLLLSADVFVTGPTDNAVGFESFLQQQRQSSGQRISVGVRAGATTEPIANRVKTRLGGYLEPSRFSGVGYRAHLTVGGEVRLFRWDVFGLFDPFDWRVGLTFDFAERYLNWAFGVGTWH
ncbi:MAG: hypothetical protein OXR73_23815 [Myxococcales bacterium]|nr:hypothetical protein [Myxococcales bacterium]